MQSGIDFVYNDIKNTAVCGLTVIVFCEGQSHHDVTNGSSSLEFKGNCRHSNSSTSCSKSSKSSNDFRREVYTTAVTGNWCYICMPKCCADPLKEVKVYRCVFHVLFSESLPFRFRWC